MRKGLQGKGSRLFNNNLLKGILLFAGIFVFGGNWSQDLYAQDQIYVNYTTCGGSFVTGEQLMDAGGVPAGHRDGGTWVDTDGLDFSDLGRNPTITGFVLGQNYTIRWNRTPSKTYNFNISVPTQATDYSLLNESGTTSDVISAGATHNFEIDITTGSNVDFYEQLMPDGDPVLIQSSASSNLAYSVSATDVHQVYAVVTDPNGCVVMTNAIEISQGDIQIRVEGGKSVCDGSYNYDLFVRPYDPVNYDYRWLIDGTQSGAVDSETVTVTGPGSYTAEVYPDGASFVPGQLISSEEVVIGNYTLPEVTIDPSGFAALCDAATGIVLTGEMTTAHSEGYNVSYEWTYNGSNHSGADVGGPGPVLDDITVNNTGLYDFRVYETDNPLCYRDATEDVTVVTPMATFEAIGSGACSPAEPSFLVEIIGQVDDFWDVEITDGTNIVSVVLTDDDSDGVASGTIAWGADITVSTTYSISITSGSSCTITNLPVDVLFEVVPVPLIFDVSASGCVGETMEIFLSGSEADVNYELIDPSGTAIDDMSGTGGSISFTVTSAVNGDYQIRGTRGSCPQMMNGAVSVALPPSDEPVSVTGPGCSGSSHTITVSNSETDVDYSLYLYGAEVRTPRNGNGGNLEFTGVNTAGNYQVLAARGACSIFLTEEVDIDKTPDAQTISTPEGCAGTDLLVALDDSELNMEYSLYDGPDGTGNLIETISGTDNSISFTTPINTAGTYSVIASNPGTTCIRDIGDVVIHDIPDLTYTLSTTGSPVCAGTPYVMTLSGSENNIIYRLYRNDTSGSPVDVQTGDGVNPVDFAAQSEAGTYLVTADNNGCEYELPNAELIIYKQPQQYAINSFNACVGDNVDIVLSDSEDGVTYVLLRDNSPYGSSMAGSAGSSITFGPEEFPQGTYEVRAYAGGCTTDMSGSVNINSLPSVNINNVSSDYCANAGVVNISASPSTGNNSWGVQGYIAPNPSWFIDNGDETAYFNVDEALAIAGDATYFIYYLYEDPTTLCVSGDTVETTFHSDLADNLDFHYRSSTAAATDPWTLFPAGDLTVCEDGDPIDLEGFFQDDSDPVGDGTFSGTGVTDTGSGTAEFDPAVAGNGNHTITYTYTDPLTTCTGTVTHTVQIGTSLEFPTLNAIYCATDPAFDIYGDDLSASGITGTLRIYEGHASPPATPFIYEQLNNSSSDPFSFSPSAEGPGDYLIQFTYHDGTCDNVIEYELTVAATLDPSFSTASGLNQFCETESGIELVPNQTGGLFTINTTSGDGVSGYYFDPSHPDVIAGNTYTITYTINTGTCSASSTMDVSVIASPTISISGLSAEYCDNESGPFLIEPNNDGIAGAEYTFSTTTNAIGRSPLYYDNGIDTIHVDSYTYSGGSGFPLYFDPVQAGYGSYTVTYTFDNSANTGCETSVSQTVTVHETLGVNFAGTADPIEYCQSAAPVTLEGSFAGGGFTGEGNFSGAGIDNLTPNDGVAEFDPSAAIPGDHPILYEYVDPTTGCYSTKTKTFTVKETPAVYNVTPNASTSTYPGRFCSGDDVEIGVDDSQDGVEYQLILNGNVASPVETISGDASVGAIFFTPVDVPGNYTVRAVWTSPSGCPQWMNGTVEVRENNVTASISKQNVSCYSGNDGEISVTASGGTAPYVYQISDDGGTTFTNNPSNTFSPLEGGTYHIRVIDDLGCQLPAPIEVVISEPADALSVTTDSSPVAGCNVCTTGSDCEGEASVSVSGGTPFADFTTYPSGYDIKWWDQYGNVIPGSDNQSFISQMPAGNYTVWVTDANGCRVEDVIEIETLSAISLSEVSHTDPDCNGTLTGEFTVIATGGDTNAEYRFSTDGNTWLEPDVAGGNERTFSNRPAGTYNVYVRDANYPRCEYHLSSSIILTDPAVLSVSEVTGSHVDVTCYGDADGQFEVQAVGGTSPYEYSFDSGTNYGASNINSGLSGGNYNVIVQDDNSCTAILSSPVTISEPEELIIDNFTVSNVSCNSGNDGSISVTAQGGNGNYGYSLAGTVTRPDQASPVFNLLPAGTYHATVTDGEGCNFTYSDIVVSEPANPLTITLDSSPAGCAGETDGEASVAISGGTPFTDFTIYPSGYLVEWTDSSGNSVTSSGDGTLIENLNAGDYNVTVTDANGCNISDGVTVDVVADIVLTEESHTNVSCNGIFDGQIVVSATGGQGIGTANYQFSIDGNTWFNPDGGVGDPDNNSRTFNSLSTGTYDVFVRDVAYPNCEYQLSTSITITEPVVLTVAELLGSHVDVDCNGNNTGQFEVEANGGTGSYDYYINGTINPVDPNSGVFANLTAGFYTVHVEDDNGCVANMAQVEITESDPVNISDYTVVPVSCYSGDDGSIAVTAIGGDGIYVYSITNGPELRPAQSGNIFNNLPAGTNYEITVADSNGCDTTYPGIIVGQPASAISLASSVDQNVLCRGGSTGAFTITASGGSGGYEFSIDGGTTWEDDGTNSYSWDGLDAGTYTVDVRDAKGCTTSESVTITQPATTFTLSGVVDNHVSCHDGSDASITVDGDEGTSLAAVYYVIYKEVSTSWIIQDSKNNTTGDAETFPDLDAGNYRVEAWDSNVCTDDVSLTVTEPSAAINITSSISNVTTSGGNDGSIEIEITDGSGSYPSIIWSGTEESTGNPVAGLVDNVYLQPNLVAGTYFVSVTDDNGCTVVSDPMPVTDPDTDLGLSIAIDEPGLCSGATNGTISLTATGGVPSYTSVTLTRGGVEEAKATSGSDYATYTGLGEGTYVAEVVDDAGNVYTENIVFTLPDALALNFVIDQDASCNGAFNGTITFSATDGTPEDNGTPVDVTDDYYNYFITPPSGTVISGLLNEGGSETISNLPAGDGYKLEILDANDCFIDTDFDIKEPDPISFDINSENLSCFESNDGEISVTNVDGGWGNGYSYAWEVNNAGSWDPYPSSGQATTPTVNSLPAGTYRVIVTGNLHSCTTTSSSIQIAQPEALALLVSGQKDITTCNGDNSGEVSLRVEGGTANYDLTGSASNLNWDGSGTFVATGLYGGTNTFTVLDNKGCIASGSVDILEPEALVVSNVDSQIECESDGTDGELEIEIIGGRVNPISGDYSYRVELVNQNTGNSLVSNHNVDPAIPTSVVIPGIPAGNYDLEITDANSTDPSGCAYTDVISLSYIDVQSDITDVTCAGAADGAIDITVSGGSGSYTYVWSDDGGVTTYATSQDLSGLAKGSYELTVTDTNRGCTLTTLKYQVEHGKTLVIDASVSPVSCHGGSNGAILIDEVVSASPTVNYFLDGVADPDNDGQWTGLSAGTYEVSVVDGDDCVATQSYYVSQPLAIDFSLSTTLDCSVDYDRTIELTGLTGGTPPYTYTWSGPGGFTEVSDTEISGITIGGTYNIRVTDDRNCSVTRTIEVPGKPLLTADVTPVQCNGGANGIIDLSVSDGSNNYSYLWNDATASTSQDLSGLEDGTYEVTVTDASQICDGTGAAYSDQLEVEVTEPDPIIVDSYVSDVTCSGAQDGEINITSITGGAGGYSLSWDSSPYLTPNAWQQTDLPGGEYSVVISSDGCSTSRTFTVDEDDPLDFTLTVDASNCSQENSLTISLPTGGTGDYEYIWAGSGVDNSSPTLTTQSNLPGGEYTVTMVDVGNTYNCHITKTATLTKPLAVTSTTQPETCPGANNGSIDLTPDQGVAPYTYSWSTVDGSGLSATEQDQAGLSAGTYEVIITDSNPDGGGCTETLEIEVGLANTLSIAGNVTNVRCFGASTGALDINVTGGTDSYNYSWTGPYGFTSTAKNISSLPAGSYTVVVTDEISGTSCSVTRTFSVDEPVDFIDVTDVNITDVLCRGAATGEIDITVSGGASPYQYQWVGPGTIADPTSQDIAGLRSGNYNVLITDANGCVLDYAAFYGDSINVPQPAETLDVSLINVEDLTTNGVAEGSIEIEVTGGTGAYTIRWFDENGDPVPSGDDQEFIDELSAGTYRVTVVDENLCDVELTNIIVRQPGELLQLIVSKRNVGACNASDNGSISVDMIGGTLPYQSITLYNGGEVVDQVTNDNGTVFTDVAAGDYEVVGMDFNGVEVRFDVRILEPSPLLLNASVTTHVECYNSTTGVITVSVDGGVPHSTNNYRVSLSGGPSGTSEVQNPAALTDITFDDLPAGTYTIRVIDDSNVNKVDGSNDSFADGYGDSNFDQNTDCYVEQQLTVLQPEAELILSTITGSEEICENSSPTLQLITANWDFGVDGNLEVTLSDGETYTVDQSPFQFVPITVPATGITQYSIVSVEDATGCSKGTGAGIAVVEVHPLPTATLYGDAQICLGESTDLGIELTGNGPWNVAISDGTTIWNETFTGTFNLFEVSPVVDVTYEILSVSDIHCSNTGTGTVNVGVNELADVTLTGNAEICEGSSTNLNFNFTAGTAPYEVTYLAITSTETTEHTIGPVTVSPYDLVVSPDVTTDYKLVSVMDTKGCEQTVTGEVRVTVREWPERPLAIAGDDVVCEGSTQTYSIDPVANATGYVWSLPAGAGTIVSGQGTTSIVIDYAADAPETANLSVYAVNSCGDGANYTLQINIDQLPQTIGAISGEPDLCQGSTGIRYSVPQVNDASVYNWTVPAGFIITSGQSSSTIEVDLDPALDATIGDITVTPENNCGVSESISTFEVEVHPLPDAKAGVDQQLCNNSTTLDAIDPSIENSDWEGQWTIISGYAQIATPDDPKSAVTNISRGDVVLRWTVTNTATPNNCSVSDEVTLRNNKLSVQADAEQTLTCDGSTDVSGTIVPAYTNTSGNWSIVPGEGSGIFDDASLSGTTVYDLAPGPNTLRWTITQNTCESYGEVVVVNDQPDQAVIFDQDIIDVCGTDTMLSANHPVEGIGVWSVEKGRATILATNAEGNEISLTNLAKGENIIRWTITKNGNCSTYDEVTIRNNMLDVDAGDDYTTCMDVAILDATPPPDGVVGQWAALGDAEGEVSFVDGNAYNTQVNGLINGENQLQWTLNQNNCESSDIINITSNRPTLATVGSAQTICNTDTVLSGNQPESWESGRWSVVEGSGKFEDLNDPETRVSGVGMGTNVYRWTIYNGNCTTSADLSVVNHQVTAFAGKDTVSCDRFVYMNADVVPDGYTGEWSVESGFGSAVWDGSMNDPKVGVRLALGENSLRWTVSHNGSGCASSDVVNVLINAIENVEAGGDQTINDGSGQATMQADLPDRATGEWSIITGGATIVNVADPGTVVNNLSRGPNVFRWTVRIGNCMAYDEVEITNGDVVEAETGPDIFTCSTEAYLNANDPDNAIGKWTLGNFGAGKFENDQDPETRVYDLGAGENQFVWTISYGQGTSFSTDTIVVTNNQPDEARPNRGSVICGDVYTLEGNEPDPGMGTVSWRIISGSGSVANDDQPITDVTGLSQGENKFIYTVQKGDEPNVCYSSDTVTVTNGEPTTAYAGEDDTLCTDSVLLDPNVPNHGTGEWRIHEGAAEFEGNWAKNIDRGTNKFLWVISTEYCTSVDTVVIVNNEPSIPNAGRDRPVCTDTLTLSGSLPTYHTGEWTLIAGAGVIEDPISPNSKVTGLGDGNNRFRWTITNENCSDFDDVVIRNDFVEAVIGFDNSQPLCTDTAELRANNPLPGVGTWGVVGGGGSASFDDPSDPNTVVRDLQQGENILTWSITNGHCTDVDMVSVINNKPTPADAGANKATCDNSVFLAANNPEVGDGTWTLTNGSGTFSSSSDPSARVDGLKFGSNIFRWTVVNEGCESYDDVQIDFNSIEASAGKDSILCSDMGVLHANNASPGTGMWSVAGGTSQATFDDINDPNTTVRNLRKGVNTLQWTIDYKGCQTSSEVALNNASPSTSYAGNTQRLCDSETVLDAMDPEIGVGRWVVISGSATVASVNDPHSSVSGLQKGDNVLRWVVENDICSSEDEVRIVNNLPSTPYAGADLEVCEPDHDLMAATPEFGDGLWSIVEGGGNISNVTDPRAEIRNLRAGRNVLKWTLTKGQCTLSDEIVIENNTATTANAGPDVADCKDWALLDANPGIHGDGEWSIVSGNGDFRNPADEATTIDNLGFGENILLWEIWNGNKCFSRDTVVIFNKVPEQSDAGRDKVLCENYTTLNGNSPPDDAIGTWTVVSGAGKFDDPDSNSSIVREVGFGDNVYKWTLSYEDCVTESTVNVKSNKTDAYAGEDVVVYDPEVILNGNNVGDLNAQWSIVGGTGKFDDPAFFNTLVEGLSEGINMYRWTIEVSGCTSFDDVSVEYRPVPDAGFITNNDEGCWPLEVIFTNYSVGAQERDYHWEFGDGASSGDQNPTHIFEVEGNYPVILTVPGPDGIEGRYQKIIRVHGHPEAAFSVTPEEVYVPGDEVRFFDLSAGAVDYEWHFGDGNISNEAHPVHEYTEGGVYNVMLHVTNEYGCVDSTTIESAVTAISKGFIKFPSAFKPRPDGGSSNRASETNNKFKPVYRDVDSYNLQVYNRWGQLIYESNDIDEGWNGLYKSQLAPQAVYVWKVNGTFVNGREYRQTGSVLLVR